MSTFEEDIKPYGEDYQCTDNLILGAIGGDILGSPYEWCRVATRHFVLLNQLCKFTDDTVMTVATMKSLILSYKYGNELTEDLIRETYRELGRKYYYAGYGPMFRKWLSQTDDKPINSYGNGSGMRISPVGWWAKTEEETIDLATRFSIVSHNHPEGIKGGVAIALAVFYAKNGLYKIDIAKNIQKITGYDLQRELSEIRKDYSFNATCQKSVPESIIAFLESQSYEDAVINAIWLGGDADTMACMAGGIAEARYGTDKTSTPVREFIWSRLPKDFKHIITKFSEIVNPYE